MYLFIQPPIFQSNEFFGPIDEAVVEKYLPFCGIGLRNAQLYERSQLEVKRNQVLLDLAGVIFQVSYKQWREKLEQQVIKKEQNSFSC